MTWKDTKVLITGGLGFIGSNLALKLVEEGARITVIDSLLPNYGGKLHNIRGIRDRITVNISDIRDSHSMAYLVEDQEIIFNLAGQTSHMDSMIDPHTDLDINCTAQLAILEACRKRNPSAKIVFASTRQFYGKPEYLPVDENHPTKPVDVNGIHKLAGESYHLLYNDVYDIQSTALRLTNTYGPRMRVVDGRQTFVGIWIRLALEGKAFEVWGGDQLRDFNYVDDVVNAMVLCVEKDNVWGQFFNLGGECAYSLIELAEIIQELAPTANYIRGEYPQERKKIDIGDYYSSWEKFQNATGWTPRVDLKTGILRTLNYYREELSYYLT